jgi:hypothetical protein
MHIKYKPEDGSVIYPEISPELAEFIMENDREIANLERRERYHAPYHFEILKFEGEEFVDHMIPEDIVIRREELKAFYEFLSFLTATQLHRLLMKAERIRNCKYVLTAIQKAGLIEVSRRDIMRLCRTFRTKDEVQPVIDQLADYGYLAEKAPQKRNGPGRNPSAVYLVNPHVLK